MSTQAQSIMDDDMLAGCGVDPAMMGSEMENGL